MTALAVTLMDCVPSVTAFSIAVQVKGALVDPAAMTTEIGTLNRVGVAEESATVSAAGSVPGIVTVPVAVAPSVTVGTVTDSARVSLS